MFSSNKRQIKQQLSSIFSSDEVSESAIDAVYELAAKHNVESDEVNLWRAELFQAEIESLKSEIQGRRRLSPEDEARIQELASKYRVSATLDQSFDTYRELWRFENEDDYQVSPINIGMALPKGEEAYAGANCIWYRIKRRRETGGFVGGSVGVRVAKGVTLRVGQYFPMSEEVEDLVEQDAGDLIVTNKKLLFLGDKKTTNITYGRIVDLRIYSDGIAVYKTSGPVEYFGGLNEAQVDDIQLIVNKLVGRDPIQLSAPKQPVNREYKGASSWTGEKFFEYVGGLAIAGLFAMWLFNIGPFGWFDGEDAPEVPLPTPSDNAYYSFAYEINARDDGVREFMFTGRKKPPVNKIRDALAEIHLPAVNQLFVPHLTAKGDLKRGSYNHGFCWQNYSEGPLRIMPTVGKLDNGSNYYDAIWKILVYPPGTPAFCGSEKMAELMPGYPHAD